MVRCAAMLLVSMCCLSALSIAGITEPLKPKGGEPTMALRDTSAPDAWGYTWVRSTDPGGPQFRWIDITTRGTLVTGLGDDNSVGPFPIQFQFPYYWYTVTNFRVGSNGYVVFGNQTANFASPFAALPNTAAPNDMLAICVGDLDFTVAAANPQCYYWSNGADSLVVSFLNVTEWQQTANPNLKHTFQVILCKTDSTIVYQYGEQQGQYNATNNTTLCIGQENQTGQIGLSYTFSSTPPHALMPTNGLAIRIKRTVDTGLSVTDAGIVGGFNAENLARMFLTGQADTVKTIVKNFGTINLSNVRVTYSITKTGQPTALDTVFIPSMAPSAQQTVSFPRLFTPAVDGPYSASFTAFVAGDQGPGNNSKVTELLAATFSTSASTVVAYESNVQGTTTSWTGGGGFGVAFDLPASAYPVRVESVYVRVSVAGAPMTVEILDGSTGIPGAVLATTTVASPIVGMNGISFVADNVVVNSGRFFAGARGTLTWSLETQAPISYRTWEYTNGYAPYRSADVSDMILRVAVRKVTTDVNETSGLPERLALSQNYPNPFNPSTHINYSLPEQARVTLAIYDVLGREVRSILADEVKPAGEHVAEWDGKDTHGLTMPSGTYFMRLTAGTHSESKKLLLLK